MNPKDKEQPPADRKLTSISTSFTLIELLAVMVVISILAVVSLGVAHYVSAKAGTARARAEIAAMENALESFKNDTGYYPQGGGYYSIITNGFGANSMATANASTNVYNAVAGGAKKYMSFRASQLTTQQFIFGGGSWLGSLPGGVGDTNIFPGVTITNIIDPFGTPYFYCSPGSNNPTSFDLWSFGPDRVTNAADNITNWQQ